MKVKEYEMPNGRKAVFEYDENGVGKITLECMDMLMGLINDRKTEPKPICESCSKNPCKKKEMINAIGHWVSECTEFDHKTEPQTEEWYTYQDEQEYNDRWQTDEPQTDCSWQKGE